MEIQRKLREKRYSIEEKRDIENDLSFSSWSGESTTDLVATNKEASKPIPAINKDNDDHHYLWVYEPSDLDDFTVDEVKQLWESRTILCGSIEAGAEALAILEVDSGVTESYLGWQKYINHESLMELRDILSKKDRSDSFSSTVASSEEVTNKIISEPPSNGVTLLTPDVESLAAASVAMRHCRSPDG